MGHTHIHAKTWATVSVKKSSSANANNTTTKNSSKSVKEILKNVQLIKQDGTTISGADALASKKRVLVYFSAHWCPPCRMFTPVLKDFYAEVEGEGIEIVFVSSDQDEAGMISYMKESHGDWFAVPHGSDAANKLKEKYQISGIPTLVVVKKDGTMITKDGRGAVQGKGPQAAKEWKK